MIGSASILVALAAAQLPIAPGISEPLKIELSVARTQSDVLQFDKASEPATSSAVHTFHCEKTIEPVRGGYRVTLNPTPSPHTVAGENEPTLGTLLGYRVTYTAGDDLAPVSVYNWADIAQDVAMGGRMDAKQAATFLLKEEQLLAYASNTSLTVGHPLIVKNSMLDLTGGPPLDTTDTLEIESVDPETNSAMLRWKREYDPASARRLAAGMLQLIAGNGVKPLSLEGFKVERTSECRYRVDTRSKLPLTADCVSKLAVADPVSGMSSMHIDQWKIVQIMPVARGEK